MFDHLWRVVLRLGVVFIVCLPLQIKASIISADDSTFGAGTLTRDTLQGLDFLDVTFSVGLTRAYVSSQFGTGGQFAGFRYATDDEVINLINNTGFNPVAVSGADVAGTNGIDYLSSLVSLLDPILSNTVNDAVFGQAVCSLAPGACRISIYDRHVQGSDLVNATGGFGFNQVVTNYGSYLVKSTPVPGPATFLLLVVGILSLWVYPRKLR